MKGTKFQIKVWKYLKKIPRGKVKSYKEVAIGINMPKSARAVAGIDALSALAEVAATGLNDSHIQTKIAPLLNAKAAELSATPPA